MQEPTPKGPSTRTQAGVLLFLACSLLSTARIVLDAPSPRHADNDIAIRSDERFAALKSRLPAYGVVGYLGESGDSATPDYYLTQYALAPLIVDPSPDHALVIANFPNAPTQIPPGMQVAQDFGHGVLLLTRKDSQ